MFRFECDKVYELYGYRADETYTFPIEAYYQFCKKRGIPFPIDWRPKGESYDYLYSLAEATALMLGLDYWDLSPLDNEVPFDVENDGFAAPAVLKLLRGEIKQSLWGNCWVFNGYVWKNPANASPWWKARFPIYAFYRWWLKDDHGIDAPRWFSHLASDCLPPVPALPPMVAEEIDEADESMTSIPVAPVSSSENAEIMDGVTVATLRKVFDHSPALRDIVAAVADWQKPATNGGELSRRSVNEILQLKQVVEDKATAGNWGTDKGKLSEPQGRVIERLIFGRSSGGSGNSSVWYGTRDKTKKKG